MFCRFGLLFRKTAGRKTLYFAAALFSLRGVEPSAPFRFLRLYHRLTGISAYSRADCPPFPLVSHGGGKITRKAAGPLRFFVCSHCPPAGIAAQDYPYRDYTERESPCNSVIPPQGLPTPGLPRRVSLYRQGKIPQFVPSGAVTDPASPPFLYCGKPGAFSLSAAHARGIAPVPVRRGHRPPPRQGNSPGA